MRSNGSHGHAGPAARATTDSILARLNEESPYASMLHEELPDWLDIERRPTPRPAPRPVPKPKEKAVIPETKPNLREADREFFREALITIGRGAQTLAVEECDLDYGNLQRWLDTGIGISAERLDRLMAWARQELAADDPTARVRARWDDARCRMSEARKGVKQRGKPHPKTDLEEPARAEVAAALKRVGRGPCSVSAELFRHTGMANWLKTGKGLGPENVQKALEWARSVRQVVSHHANGEAVYEWAAEEAKTKIVTVTDTETGETVYDNSETFVFEPYPETTTKGGGLNQPPSPPPSRQKLCQWCYAWTNPGERCACPRVNTEPEPEPAPDPASFVLETWAAQRLTYAMETLGLTMPEGYRFRVTVERVAG